MILNGEVVAGMNPDDPKVEGSKNDPMHPVAWLRNRVVSEDVTQRIFATTMGSARDWIDEDLRRLFVQSALWCLDDKSSIDTSGLKMPPVTEYNPTQFGFGGARLGYKPEDYRNGSPWLIKSTSD